MAERLTLLVFGSVMIGLGVSLFLHARLGLPPFDVLLSAIVDRTGLTHGQAAWSVSGSLLALVTLLGRRPSLFGVVFVLTNGASVDAWSMLIADPDSLVTRLLFVALGVMSIAGGIALVAHSSSTGGPFELLTRAAGDRNLNPTVFRSFLELSTVATGVALGGSLGVGTLIFVFSIGPTISFAVQALSDREVGRRRRLHLGEGSG